MNLLKKELEKCPNNKVISFEPLLEGRFEIIEILELFYLKLCSSIKEKHHKSNPILKKLLNSLAAISFAGSKFSIKGIIDIDVDDKYDKLIEIWQRNEIMDFSSQTKELNKFFINENLRIFIFIDELDRLPASHIANFLAFARILETFERLFCIVGFDYGQVVKSLIASSDNSKNNYERAKSYLDKLFQARFHIHHEQSVLYRLVRKGLDHIDENIFKRISSHAPLAAKCDIVEIADYLNTPRQIKKWLICIESNKVLVTSYPEELMEFLMLSSVFIKHPIVIENVAKHTLPMLNYSTSILRLYIERRYGYELGEELGEEREKEIYKILISSTGIRHNSCTQEKNNGFDGIIKENIIDPVGFGFAEKAIPKLKQSFLSLFIYGYTDEYKARLYYNYFENTEEAINWIIENYNADDKVLADIERTLIGQQGHPKDPVPIELLNELWCKGGDDFYMYHPRIVLFILTNHPIKKVISLANLGLLEAYLYNILTSFNVRNINGTYDINRFRPMKDPDYINYSWIGDQELGRIKFSEKKFDSFEKEDIVKLLGLFVKRIENDLEQKLDDLVENECRLIYVLHRYIQWSSSINFNNRDKLSKFFTVYLENIEVNKSNKLKLTNMIFENCILFPVGRELTASTNPMYHLFDLNKALISWLKLFSYENKTEIKHISDFMRCIDPEVTKDYVRS